MKCLYIFFMTIGIGGVAEAQPSTLKWPKVGAVCPDYVLHNITYFPRKSAKVSDFRGKWLVLDFWNKVCSSCILHFPGINDMQKEFGGKVQFMLVGIEDKENEIREKYRTIHDNMPLELPCSFDSALANELDIYGTPITFIIDPNGVVRATTAGISHKDVVSLLNGEREVLPLPTWGKPTIAYSRNKPFLVNGNGGADTSYTFRSMFLPWTPAMTYTSEHDIIARNGRFDALMVDMNWLYRVAYLGDDREGRLKDSFYHKLWTYPIVERGDSTDLFGFEGSDPESGDGYYCYSLTVPPGKNKRDFLMGAMQRDLQNYFGYTVSIEERRIPCWKLVVTDDAAREKLKAKGGKMEVNQNLHRYAAKNLPISYILNLPPEYDDRMPLYNATGIQGNVDITLDYGDGCWLVQRSFLKAYQDNELSFVRSDTLMMALVIRVPTVK